MPAAQPSLLEARRVVKRFGQVLANDAVDFELRAGEIHALLGENGAGKSTLSKILYGYYRADDGAIVVNGKAASIASPADARTLGIGMVFQSFTLIPTMTVLENIALFLTDLPFAFDPSHLAARTAEFANRFGFALNLKAKAVRLSAGEQQQVEIVKQLLAGARVLILDEPTKVLTPQEAVGLFRSMALLKAEGYGVIFITHKLAEVFACADRITVMRQGQVVACLAARETNEATLQSLMFGGDPPRGVRVEGSNPPRDTTPIVELVDVSTASQAGALRLRGVSLQVRPGEIVGVAGISGNGQRELADAILGTVTPTSGTRMLWGRDETRSSIARIRESGVAFIPDDPQAFASFGGLSVRENLALGTGRRFAERFGVNWAAVEASMSAVYARLGFAVPNFAIPAGALSGGNLQRLVIARELFASPGLIVALYPTRGLDARSTDAVRSLLVDARQKGAAILLFSEELEELFGLSDRIAVLKDGAIAAWFEPADYQVEKIAPLMVREGARLDHAA